MINGYFEIEGYVDKYSKKHGIIFVEDALKCMMVQNYALYLIKEGKNEH